MAWLGAVRAPSALCARRSATAATAGQICFVRPSIVVLIALEIETGNRHLPLATGVSELIPTPS